MSNGLEQTISGGVGTLAIVLGDQLDHDAELLDRLDPDGTRSS